MASKNKRPREDFELVAYCARCGLLEASDIPAEYFRRWVRCPKDGEEDKIHHAAVVMKGLGQSWLRVEQFFLNWELLWGLKARLTNLDSIFDELWVYMTSLTVVLAVLLVVSCNTSSVALHALCGFIAALIVADILLVNTSIAFVSRFPLNPLRSVWRVTFYTTGMEHSPTIATGTASSEVIARDCEGYVAKDKTSQYEAGPTRRWLKVKQKGWTDAEVRWQRVMSQVDRG